MKLQSHISRTYEDKEGEKKKYLKHWIIVPNGLLEKLGWKRGDELEAEVKDKKLIIEKED